MYFILGNLQGEYSSLLQEVNNYEFCTISSIDDLKSGFIMSQIILSSIHRQDLFTVIQGFSKESISARWSVIIDFMKIHFHCNLSDFYPDEIQNDSGVLFIVCKIILKSLSKNSKKYSQGRIWSSLNTSNANIYKTFTNEEDLMDLQDEKTSIHKWLQELKLIPPGIYMHEFLYRVRYGVSLLELLKRLEIDPVKIEGIVLKPKSVADCIKNINFCLRFLRKATSVNRRFLYTSAGIYEGNQEVIYGLLSDIRGYYLKKKNERVRKSPSPKRVMIHPATPKPNKGKFQISTSTKHSIIEWISSLGLLKHVIFSDSFTKNTLENGTLICELIQKLFNIPLNFTKSPQNLEDCQTNFFTSLKFLEKQAVFKVSSEKIIVSEEFAWEILFELMNNFNESNGKSKLVVFKDLEEKVLTWLKSSEIINFSIQSIFDVIPLVQSGQVLARVVSKFFPDSSEMVESDDNLEVIQKSLDIFKNTSQMSQRFTQSFYEIYKGELVVVIGLLEDLLNFTEKYAKVEKKTGNLGEFRSFKQGKELEEWMMRQNIKINNLTGNTLNEFKNGLKICEIIEKICKVRLENLVICPKTNAQALWNLRKGLEALYSTTEFPMKYKYLDDLIVSGDGETIRSFLNDLLKLS